MNRLAAFIPKLWSNLITLFGAVLTTFTGLALIIGVGVELAGAELNQYASSLLYLILPTLFVVGLLLIPVGLFYERRFAGKHTDDPVRGAFQAAFELIYTYPRARNLVIFVAALTVANVAILTVAGYRGLHFVDSPQFCGTVCHSVMQPEFQAYQRSPHSRVPCVDCHIGAGATWAAKAKVDGLKQVWAVLTNTYDRPIPAPVHSLRPARETCERCHWPAKFHGGRLGIYTHYKNDRENSAEMTALLLRVGGVDPKTGEFRGIHWHVSPNVEVRYQALDGAREKIGRVTKSENGEVKAVYERPGQEGAVSEERVMDCVDCHNRPTHIYDRSAGTAVDSAIDAGRLDRNLPFLRKVAVKTLEENIAIPRDRAEPELRRLLGERYAAEHPQDKPGDEVLDKIAKVLAEIYLRNIFPDMGVRWDTYPAHIGHRGSEDDTRGCFRCHDDKHVTKDKKALSQDCDLCHYLLHEEEAPEDVPATLRSLGDPSIEPWTAEEEEEGEEAGGE
ncbi:MAG: NapC/NirT family cytochrome c [Candidatus Schekmanbacteria bacterium]|nr:NapC/NirT family cytochrome c [Candidatus Schekmanbacteria bacterium]